MKKSTVLIIITLIVISSSLIIIRIYQNNQFSAIVQSLFYQEILQKNQIFIDRVITLCEDTNDDANAFATKAWSIIEDQYKWALQIQNNDIFKQKPGLVNKIDEQWLAAIDKLASSFENDSNTLQREKKAIAINIIGRRIKPETIINYFKNKPGVNQEAFAKYIELTTKK